MFVVAERFLDGVTKEYGRHPVSTDGGTWYPQACKFLKLKHHIHLPYEKSIIEKEQFNMLKIEQKVLMIIFPCTSERRRCKLEHILNVFNLYICNIYYFNIF